MKKWKTIKEYIEVIRKMVDAEEDDNNETIEINVLIGVVSLIILVLFTIYIFTFVLNDKPNVIEMKNLKLYCCEKKGTYQTHNKNYVWCGTTKQSKYSYDDYEKFLEEGPKEEDNNSWLSQYVTCERFIDNYSGCFMYKCEII